MARDRFIWMDEASLPPLEHVLADVKEYIGDLATVARFERISGRIIVNLPGKFKKYGEDSERWIEVIIGLAALDVITRSMDDPTNDIADGIARMLARKYKGRIEKGDLSDIIKSEEK